MIIAIAIFFAYICAKVRPSTLLYKEMTANLKRFKALVKLGDFLLHFNGDEPLYTDLNDCVKQATAANGWFTYENITKAFTDWGNVLTEENLKTWLQPYNLVSLSKPKNIALILAGNIPLVGFHDFVCGLMSGDQLLVKLSSEDNRLLPLITKILQYLDSGFEDRIEFAQGPLKGFDAVIATGSDNSARYFDRYFAKHPHLIRKNRNSVAVISGDESKEDLVALGDDIFAYYGLGCRNVSKIYVPEGYDFGLLFEALYHYKYVIDNKKYANNFDYHRALFLMGGHEMLENGFLLLKEDEALSSPISMLHYETYKSLDALSLHLMSKSDSIQCIVSKLDLPNSFDLGQSQCPGVDDYADGVDTMAFLVGL